MEMAYWGERDQLGYDGRNEHIYDPHNHILWYINIHQNNLLILIELIFPKVIKQILSRDVPRFSGSFELLPIHPLKQIFNSGLLIF